MKSEVKATRFCELTELLFEGAWDESLKRFRSPFAFRGLSSAAYPLKTSLMRLLQSSAHCDSTSRNLTLIHPHSPRAPRTISKGLWLSKASSSSGRANC